ncbi:NAD-dependent dehydratase, partial [Pseudomonas aeruginosa]
LRLLTQGEAGADYNDCSGQEQKNRELIAQQADNAQVQQEIVQDPARMRRAEQRRVRGSHARLLDATGWKPEITIKQSLRAILSEWESRVLEE